MKCKRSIKSFSDGSITSLRKSVLQHSPDSLTSPQIAARVIREGIITGILAEGSALKQDQIADELEISKIPVREALRELEMLGLVDFVPNRGFLVSKTSISEMQESFKLRRMLELFAITESILLTTPQQLDKAERTIEELDRLQDPLLSSHLNLELHLTLYQSAQMKHLNRMIIRAHNIAHRYTNIYTRIHGTEQETQEEHLDILAAYREKDMAHALALMEAHLSVSSQKFSAFLTSYLMP